MITRKKLRIDYQRFNAAGVLSYISSSDDEAEIEELSLSLESCSIIESSTMANAKKVMITIDVLKSDILDLIDETPENASMDMGVVEKLEGMRSMYRAKNLELISMGVDNDDDDGKRYKEECDTTLAQIKDYIKKVKYLLSVKDDKKEEIKQKENSILFLAEHTEIRITELNTIFGRKISQASDEELLSWKGEMVENDRRFESVAEKYQKLLKFPATNIKTIETVKRIGLRYELLSSSKTRYETSLTQTVIERELDKKNLFRESNLNIQLPKFSGYESSIDIYTFQSEFEKVYAHKTPTYLLPDLLINNFISEPALSLVKGLQKINEIWVRLKQAYGDTKFIIMKRLNLVCAMESISKKKDPEKIMYMLSKMVNAIKDLMRIASEHNIENHLYYGDGLQRIYKVLDEARVTRWLVTICEENLDEEDKWKRLLLFLEKEMKVQQQKALLQGNKVNQKETDDGKFTFKKNSRYNHSYFAPSESASNNHEEIICHICGQSPGSSDHVVTAGPNGSKVIQYFSCKTFVDKNPAERFAVLKSKNLCFQCLLPGADAMTGKHKEGKCQHDFTCKHAKHSNYTSKKHVLVCDEHKYDNTELLNTYKQQCMKNSNIPSFSRNIKLSFHSDAYHSGGVIKTEKTDEVGIYLLQRIKVNDQLVNVFFDNGCSDCVIKHATAKRLDSAASQVYDGRISIGGVGNSISESNHGIYSIKMPLYDGKVATLSAICLDQITFKFPTYPLEDVEKEIHVNYRKIGGDPNMLPRSSITVGGETDIMIGIKYLRYHPKPIFQLPSGLCIYESVFNNAQGGRGVIGGPHEIFSRIHQKFDSSKMRKSFFTHQQNITSILFNIDPDVSLIGFKDEIHTSNSNISEDEDSNNQVQVTQGFHSKYLQSEQVGSEINYRCINCRQCQVCKHHKQIEAVSIKEEVEQDVINKSISIDINNNVISAYLPFIQDPALKLAPNKNKALKVYFQQLRKLNHPQNIKDKEDIIQSELKLQKLGYVDYLKNLPQEIRNELQNHHIQNYIPWRAVWKVSSVSTHYRVVFDASQSTLSGFSLNDLLAKGQNNLNRLQEILIRWSSHKVAFTTDVKKMYNTVKLDVKDWCYQRYVWQDDLDPGKIPDEKIIKTLIYGVRSSGNQADRGLKELANLSEDKYPEASNIVKKDMYVDDCISGDVSKDLAIRRFEEIELILNKGGFQLKGVAISNEDPPQTLSDDGVSINVAGMIWFPKSDLISLCIPEMNFAKKNRGKKSSSMNRIIPENITRRHCASRVAEVFDITGKITPITASLKLDLHELVIRKLDWDDSIPDDLRPLWLSNFELINDIGNMKFQRAIVPVDAVDLKLDTVDFADASQSLVCSAIYARFKRKNGMYSSQLVFARSKIVPKDMSLPRAELYAALLNAHTGEIVRRSFRDIHQSSIKLTDSKITLHWITNDSRPLKEWVRNRVIEILRFTKKEQWFHVKGTDMLADIGTRRGKSLRDIDDASIWINGFDWMQNDCSSFPIKSPSDLIITEEAKSEISKKRSI